MGTARQITSAEFDTEIASGPGVAVVDFGATWCGPCQALAPAYDQIAGEFEGKAMVVKVDVDQDADLAGRFNVMSVPTILFFKDGAKVDEITGNFPDRIRQKLKALV